jgi:hypothetical protein
MATPTTTPYYRYDKGLLKYAMLRFHTTRMLNRIWDRVQGI